MIEGAVLLITLTYLRAPAETREIPFANMADCLAARPTMLAGLLDAQAAARNDPRNAEKLRRGQLELPAISAVCLPAGANKGDAR